MTVARVAQDLKSLCRQSDDVVRSAADLLSVQLRKPHAQARGRTRAQSTRVHARQGRGHSAA